LFFHTNAFAAACCCSALILYCLCFRRLALFAYFVSCCIGFLSWLVWFKTLGPSLGETAIPLSSITFSFSSSFKAILMGLKATLVDLDVVDCFPMLLWMGALAILLLRCRRAVMNVLREPLISFVLASILIQAVATAALFGTETDAKRALLRYMPHLMVFGMVSCLVLLDRAISSGIVYLPLCVLAVASNLLTFSFWTKPLMRTVPVSWLPPVYSEIFQPRENSWDDVLAKLRGDVPEGGNRDRVVGALPPWTYEILIFYVGDSYLVPPILTPEGERSIHKLIGEESYRRLFADPQWIVVTLGASDDIPDGYSIAAVIPSYRASPDDGTRPELTRHTFLQPTPVSNVILFRLQKK